MVYVEVYLCTLHSVRGALLTIEELYSVLYSEPLSINQPLLPLQRSHLPVCVVSQPNIITTLSIPDYICICVIRKLMSQRSGEEKNINPNEK